MIWLVLRLHRTPLLLTAAVTALSCAVLAAGRAASVAALTSGGLPQRCFTEPGAECRRQASAIVRQQASGDGASVLGSFWGFGHAVLMLLPLLLGLLTGVGLVSRELDRGTHLLALTQNVGRTRWWAAHLLVTAPAAALSALAASAVATWSFQPLDALVHVRPRLVAPVFESSGVVPAGFALLAFAVAAVLGLLTRSAPMAVIASTLVFVTMLVSLPIAARPGYLPAETAQAPLPVGASADWAPVDQRVQWVLTRSYLDADGREVPAAAVEAAFLASTCAQPTDEECLRAAGVVAVRAEYHPADRFWPFQLAETAVLLALAAAVVAVGSVRLRRAVVP